MSTPVPPFIDGMREIVDRYDGFLLDLWGTIHDGYRPLPGVIEVLSELKAVDKRLLIISNAPRRNAAVLQRMRQIGIADHLHDGVLSSGEASHRALHDRVDTWHAALGPACYHLGPSRDGSVFVDLDIVLVDDLEDADFIVATGIDAADETVDDYEHILRIGAANRLPMICANPDLVVLRGEAREVCAGAIAARYEELDGEVFYHGKPYPPIYAAAFELMEVTDRERLVAVGDSLRTDVAGANLAGIDSVLILGGIHAKALDIAPGDLPEPNRLHDLYHEHDTRPTYVLPTFCW